MKARILRFLVEEMDFDAFAMEATWPEASRLTMMLGGIRLQSYEWFLGAATSPRFILDLRDVEASVEGADWLAASRASRFIGCCYDPDRPTAYWGETTLRTAFDVIIHYDQTRATTVLPFQYPTEF